MTTSTEKTAEQPKDSVAQIRESVRNSVGYILLNHPFYAHLIHRMKLVEIDSDHELSGLFSTAATDGANIYYNVEFFQSLNARERAFVMAHEIMHCVYQHVLRFKAIKDSDNIKEEDKNAQYWNMATDYAINWQLVQDSVGEMPKMGLIDSKYAGMNADQIYELLLKEKPPTQNTMDVHLSIDPNGDLTDGKGNKLTDEQLEGLGIDPKKAKEIIGENLERLRDNVVQAHQIAKQAGRVPAGIESLIEDLLAPKINWRQLLQATIQSVFKGDVTWMKPSRRNPTRGMILPSMSHKQTVELCVAIDTSGSIGEEQKREFISEIMGILEFYDNFSLKIWSFDTQVHNYQEYDPYNIEDAATYKMVGGGGTEIRSNYDFMKENNIQPRQLVVFTDGFNGSNNWGDPDYCPVLWIINDNKNPQVPFGPFVIYD